MTTYKGIKGLSVQTVAGDPSNLAAGDIWYDSGAKKIQGAKLGVGAWASGGNMPGPASTNTGFGTLTAGVSAGGEISGGAAAEAFHYNGTSWSAGGNLNTHRNVAGAYGTQTAGAIVGGHAPPIPTKVTNVHETYDGTSWTEAADLNTGRGYLATGSIGTTSAAIAMGGLINPELNPSPFGAVGQKDDSEEYNGTAWTAGGDLNTARSDVKGAGTQTAALFISGDAPPVTAAVEAYDGSSWTEVADVNTAVKVHGAGGSQNAAIKVSGTTGSYTVNVEQWDNTSWTEVANVSTARGNGACGMASASANGFLGGGTPPTTNVTEEWTGPVAAAVTFTSS